ncbi:hypothetical protein [Sulfurimonas sp.]
MHSDSKKYHVGKFSMTDKNSAFTVTGKVERSRTYVSELFFIEIFPFDKEKQSISIAFNVVELRSFANQLEEFQHGVLPFVEKHSGGNSNSKSLSIHPATQADGYSVEFRERDQKLFFFLPINILYGLSRQLIHLADATMDAVYKTQQHVIKKGGGNG